jgi:hypothetical protein
LCKKCMLLNIGITNRCTIWVPTTGIMPIRKQGIKSMTTKIFY